MRRYLEQSILCFFSEDDSLIRYPQISPVGTDSLAFIHPNHAKVTSFKEKEFASIAVDVKEMQPQTSALLSFAGEFKSY